MSDSGRWIENHKNGAISQNDKIKIFFWWWFYESLLEIFQTMG